MSPNLIRILGGAAIVLGLVMLFIIGSTFGGAMVTIAGIIFLVAGFMQQG